MTARINRDRRLIYLLVNSMRTFLELIHTIKCRLEIEQNQLLLLKVGDSLFEFTYKQFIISNLFFLNPLKRLQTQLVSALLT